MLLDFPEHCVLFIDWEECCHVVLFAFQGVKKVRKRVTKAVLTATIIYGLCWMTNLTFDVLGFNSPSPEYGYATYITSVALVTCNSTVNPIIYVFVSQKFREKIKSLLCCNKSNINRVESSSSGTMIYTVKPVSSGHPRGMVRRPPNTGWPTGPRKLLITRKNSSLVHL